MTRIWVAGLVRRRGGRLVAVTAGIALAVALIASLGGFLTASQATMTTRAVRSVAVDWQVAVQQGYDPAQVRETVSSSAGVRTALPVVFARSAGLSARTGATVQTTGAAVLLGLTPDYLTRFPGEVRLLSGSSVSGQGVLLAQQTASNLHVRPGDSVTIAPAQAGGQSASSAPARLVVSGVVDLPQADSLFQRVGAAVGSQPTAPPDNVVLLPAAVLARIVEQVPGSAVSTQIHVARSASLPPDPAAAYTDVTGAAHNLEASLAGAGVVGNNLGAALGAARSDAAYAQMLFLFLGLPGALLAAMLTAGVVATGSTRRRQEQALLRIRGLDPVAVVRLAAAEALLVGVVGGVVGVGSGLGASTSAFGATTARGAGSLIWSVTAAVVGLLIAGCTVLVPAVRDLRSSTVASARRTVGRPHSPWWMRFGLDIALVAASVVVFWMSSSDNYSLVLAPEGVATISVSYWAFLGPALLWLGGALVLWRLTTVSLVRGVRPLARVVRPLTGRLARTAAVSMSRQRRPLARAVVLLALAVSFAASTAAFNATYRQQAEADAQLTNGADVAVAPLPGTVLSAAQTSRLTRTPGVTRVEPIQHRYAYVGADLQDLFGVRPNSIGSVTALQDAYFQGGSAAQLMSRLAARPDSILVSDETVKDFQLQPGDRINLRIEDAVTHQLRTIPFHYAGIAKEFPTAPKDSFFIANADYVSRATGSPAVGTYLVDTSGTDQQGVAKRIRTSLGSSVNVTDITQTRGQVGSSLTSVNLAGLTRLELAFAVLLAGGAGGLVLAIGLAERRRTLAILSLLGAGRLQLRGMVLAEAVVIAVLGLVGGAVIAWCLSEMLVKVLTGVFDPPPSQIAAPWGYLGATALVVAGSLVAAAAFGARRSGRPPIEELRDL